MGHQRGDKILTFTPEEISAMVLQKMKTTAENYLGQAINHAVITVPAYFNDAQRQATKDAGVIAGLHVERIMNEPTAAAIAYGINKTAQDESTVLVFDLGGGTFDVTVLTIDGGIFEVKATNGDAHLGGADFDQRIMQYFVNIFQKKYNNIDISNNNHALQKLRKEVERVKRALSSQQQARLEIENLSNGMDLSETLTRARFEEVNNDLFRKTLGPVRRVLDDAKLRRSDIDEVILVGGSTRIPRIQQLLSNFFGKELNKAINPDEAVAYGAAIQGGILSGEGSITNEILLVDVAPFSQGVETVGGVMVKIIPRGTTIPAKKSQIFSTYQENQCIVLIHVYEGEQYMAKDNHLLGKFELSGIPPAPRGVPQIEVTFLVDVNGILQVSAEDKGTGRSEEVTISTDKGRLTKQQIDKMVEYEKKHVIADGIMKDRIDARNDFEHYLYDLKNNLKDIGKEVDTTLSTQDGKGIHGIINEYLDWLEENIEVGRERIDEKRREIENIVKPIQSGSINLMANTDEFNHDYNDDGIKNSIYAEL